MQLKASVAVWDPEENRLKIGLFPFAVTSQDIETVRKYGHGPLGTGDWR